MPSYKKVKIFVGSPGDVNHERALVEKIANRLNREISDALSLTLEVLKWETHSIPSMGRPQGLVNPLVDQCDIFVGLLWNRFGLPPGTNEHGITAESVTEEEFLRAIQRWENNGAQINSVPKIMFYFSDRSSKPSQTDPNQAIKVLNFKQRFAPGGQHQGLISKYRSLKEFERSLHQHLIRVLFDLSGGSVRAEVVTDFVTIPIEEWLDLFTESSYGYFLIMYSRTWRNTFLQQMRTIMEQGGNLRFLLPLPDESNSAFRLMAEKIGVTPEELRRRVLEAFEELNSLSNVDNGTIEIRYTRCYINHAMYLFEKGGIVALYSYLPNRTPSPAIKLNQGTLLNQCISEFNTLYQEASII